MFRGPCFIITTSLLLILAFNVAAYADVTAEPFGIAVYLEAGGEETVELILSNDGESDVAFQTRFRAPDDEIRFRRPRRDDFGDLIEFYDLPNRGWCGITCNREEIIACDWDNSRIFIWNIEEEDFTDDFALNFQPWDITYDGEAYWVGSGNGLIYRMDIEGNILGNVRVDFAAIIGVAWDGENLWVYPYYEGTILQQITTEGDVLNRIDCANIQGNQSYGLAWIPEHEDGHMWVVTEGAMIMQWNIDIDNEEIEIIQQEQYNHPGGTYGITHDGENLWYAVYAAGGDGWGWGIVDDGILEPRWIQVDPREGIIRANEQESANLVFSSEELEAGEYEMRMNILLEEAEEGRDQLSEAIIDFSVVLALDIEVAVITGSITDLATDEAIEDAAIGLDRYVIRRFSDEDGGYTFQNLPLGEYQLTFTATDYLPLDEQIDLNEAGEFNLDVALQHSECNLSVDDIIADLAPDTDTEVDFSISNDGNGPLTYTSDRRLLGDANAEPWEQRASFPVGESVDDDYLYGVVFIDNLFYISGENNGEPSIYVLNREGELVETIAQAGNDADGVRDLACNGELIWGSEQSVVLGFTPEGELESSFEGPYRPITAIAWDTDRELLWIASTTRGINGVTTDGEEVAELDRHDLRIYGLAYWQDDPDGFPLYVFNKERDTNRQTIHKIDPDSNEVQFVAYLEPEAGGSPVGAFITNQYDIYSWVFMDIASASRNAGGDRIDIWQVDARRDWFNLAPTEGVIEADEEQPFLLTLDATGLPPAEFEGEIVFTHDGVGGETYMPVTLNVVEGRIPTERTLVLGLGWNMVSTNLQPDERDVTVLTETLVEADLLEMMKDGSGHFYNPEFGFNNIPGWFVEQGYMMKVRDDCELTLEGMSVLAEDPIDLVEGWQIVAYYPRRPVEAILALSGIVDQLLIAKDGEGQFYIPEFGFSNMGDLREGQGYQLKMDQDARLIYTLQEEEVAGIPQSGRADIPACPGRVCRHFGTVTPTGENMSLLVIAGTPPFNSPPAEQGGMVRNSKQRGIQINPPTAMRGGSKGGVELGVFTPDGMLVGSGRFDDEGRCGVAIWGDDPTTRELDGARSGDRLEIVLFDETDQHSISYTTLEGSGVYETDELWIVDLDAADVIPTEFGIVSAYPNPFNDQFKLTYNLNRATSVDLSIYDISGRCVQETTFGRETAGIYNVTVKGSGLASGIYIVQLNAGEFVCRSKITLLR